MQLGNQDLQRLINDGVAALQQRRFADARDKLEQATGTGLANAQLWLALAAACRGQEDSSAEERALDRMLELDPQSVAGLIMKADCRARAQDDRNASSIYKKALRLASDQSVPPSLVPELQRAEAMIAELEVRHAAHLEQALAAQGLAPDARSRRFQHSIDIIAGRRHIYLQEPTAYYFPELPQIQYYDPAEFDWVPKLEAATDAIRAELVEAMAAQLDEFRPYIRSEANRPRYHPLLDKTDWSALFFCENGKRSEELIARCPRTWEAVQGAPLPWVGGTSPTIMFSLLRRGTRIPAHTGMLNTRLICHLPLIVPPGCGFRVGNETRQWQEGKLLIFDDTIEHEAWNEGGEDRVVLIFDIWRPELNETERREVAALCSIPDMHSGAAES